VNVAARLEAIARPGQILLTDATRAAVDGAFPLAEVGEQTLVGRELPVHLWELRA
jgi:adenylate cyclase